MGSTLPKSTVLRLPACVARGNPVTEFTGTVLSTSTKDSLGPSLQKKEKWNLYAGKKQYLVGGPTTHSPLPLANRTLHLMNAMQPTLD